MDEAIKVALEDWRNSGRKDSTIISSQALGGGSINQVMLVEFANGERVVVKSNPGKTEDFFLKESDGLEALSRTGHIRVPMVHDLVSDGSDNILIMEYIESAPRCPDFDEKFGRSLALLHRDDQAPAFGFFTENLIGSTNQYNDWKESWVEFWLEQRAKPQIRMAVNKGYLSRADQKLADRFLRKIPLMIDHECKPSLIHGDLWSGNIMADENGDPVIIDPAVYYADPEAEFGMIRLFGSQGPAFYDAYQEILPFDSGSEERIEIYKFYHVINHLNLFGSSYYSQCMEMMRRYS